MTKLKVALFEVLAEPRGRDEGMMTTLEMLADKRLSRFWFLCGRIYFALAELVESGEVFVAQRDLITPERGFRPRSYYALVDRKAVKT